MLANEVKIANRDRQQAEKPLKPIKQQSWEIERGHIRNKFPKLLQNQHAISVVRTDSGEVYYYDNRNKKPRLIKQPLDLASGLAYYVRVLKFELIL